MEAKHKLRAVVRLVNIILLSFWIGWSAMNERLPDMTSYGMSLDVVVLPKNKRSNKHNKIKTNKSITY